MKTNHKNISGALFEFLAYLSVREEQTVLSAYDCPGQALNVLEEFAKIYDLQLAEADVDNWENCLTKTPYGWMIQGSSRVYFGEYAETDARMEAKHCGGTCEAFPIFK